MTDHRQSAEDSATDLGQAGRTALYRGNHALAQHDTTAGRRSYHIALTCFLVLGDALGVADATCNLGTAAWFDGALADAQRHYDAALTLYRASGSAWQVAKTLQYQGNVAYQRGHLPDARRDYRQALTLLRQHGELIDVADSRVNLAMAENELGAHHEAVTLLEDAAAEYRRALTGPELTDKLAEVHRDLSLVMMELGELRQAWSLSRRAREHYAREGADPRVAALDHNLGNIAARMGRHRTAEALYSRAADQYRRRGLLHELGDCELGLGKVCRDRGDDVQARTHFRRAGSHYTASGEWLARARTGYNVGLTRLPSHTALNDLVPAWAAMQSVAWGLPEVAARWDWRRTLGHTTDTVLRLASTADPVLAAEVIESMRGLPLALHAPRLADAVSGYADAELPTRAPPLIRCGQAPQLPRHVTAAETLMRAAGPVPPLRQGAVSLIGLLLVGPP
ncbi:tetratricopeptide repeat protein [Geodermatophilus sp. DF01-2]|uniref:tetratricopeptide repeat protein n=1 Tax=Geodermatophilus sp. DF01-2 TaxID=2559610 RepID=UPI001073DC5B|nr:tetratricopeptide repeat protein [Geodermatophilus sp. DF01_2]TFV53907.1 tetratricopeptide repeat protein [Geodermatophilus sp. DF01_2]